MKRAKLGDVYCMKVPNGYKLFQWAYNEPSIGSCIRVFPGLYDAIPDNIEVIVNSQHSYIIGFAAAYAYKKGIVSFLGNYPVPDEYPFPQYELEILDSRVRVRNSRTTEWVTNIADSINDLPYEFIGLNNIGSYPSPDWLMYLFDSGFDLSEISEYWPHDSIKKYTELYKKMLTKTSRKDFD